MCSESIHIINFIVLYVVTMGTRTNEIPNHESLQYGGVEAIDLSKVGFVSICYT